MNSSVDIPRHLLEQIAAGHCIAFVGAGFSAPTVSAWKVLIQQLAERAGLDEDTSEWVEALVAHGSNRDLEAAAQVLQTTIGSQFDIALADILSQEGADRQAARRGRARR
jgi:hypothetical protein